MLTDEQKVAVMHEKGNILVSASAGSGKTFVMIERLIRLILKGVTTVDKVLAVTFTNLAAAEMKSKLMDALIRKLKEPDTDEETARRIKEQLGEVPSASISTFHSFCNDLIKNYFYELGLDASFRIADETQANILMGKALDRVLEQRYAEGGEGFNALLKVFVRNRKDEFLRKLILSLHEFFDSEAYPARSAQQAVDMYGDEGYEKIKAAFFEYYRGNFDKISRRAEEVKEMLVSVEADKSASLCDVIKAYSEQLCKAESVMQMAKLAHGMNTGKRPSITTKGDEYLESVKATFAALKEKFDKDVEALLNTFATVTEEDLKKDLLCMRATAEQLVSLCFDFDREYSALKREENIVDFADLEHFALELLDKDDIRAAVSSRYEYIFADEYQDTNGVQEEILLKISRDNLFMVGDVKQSIYAFRGCNPNIFARKFQRFSAGEGTAMSLTSNFRSSSEVLGCVNKIFCEIMTEESAGYEYKESPMRGGNGEVGAAEIHVVKQKDDDALNAKKPAKKGVYSVKENLAGNVDEEMNNEGVVIAALIKKALGGTVCEKGVERPMTYADIVILTRSMGNYVTRIADTLAENDVPVTADVKKRITVYPETRMLIAFLRLLDSVRQDVALCAVMRGPIGGFSDSELASIRAFSAAKERAEKGERKSFADAVSEYRSSGEGELKEKLDCFFDDVERWRTLADYNGAGEILSTVVREKNLDLFYSAAPDGKSRLKRIDKLIYEACAGDKAYTVREYLDRIDSSDDETKMSEVAGGDSVRIMSIHASKGLEFPVVIVCGLNERFNNSDVREEILCDREYGIALKTYDTENMSVRSNIYREFLKKRFKEASIKEEMRILYVALTRAKSALYLTQTRQKPLLADISVLDVLSANCYSNMISNRAASVFEYSPSAVRSMCVEVSPKSVIASASDAEIEKRIAESLSFVYPYDTALPAKSSVTALLHELEGEQTAVPSIFPEEEEQEGEEKEKRDAAIKKGNAYHRIMELADFEKPYLSQIIEQKEAFVADGMIDKEDAELVDESKIAEVLKDDFFRMSGAKYFRELPFEVLVPARLIKEGGGDEEVLVQGVIDLIAFSEDGIHIADYKVSRRGASALKENYSTQLELYAYAAERITGRPVVTKRLYNLSSGEKIEC